MRFHSNLRPVRRAECNLCNLNETENEIHFVFLLPFLINVQTECICRVEAEIVLPVPDTEILVWLFKCKSFLMADLLDKTSAQRKMA